MQDNNLINAIKLISEEKDVDAYSLLGQMLNDPELNSLSQALINLLNSHFHKKRSSKVTSLNNLKNLGFNPTTVVDVGAQLGTPDLFNSFPNAKHLFIEPVEECIASLKKIAITLPDVNILNCAISDFDGFTTLTMTDSKQYSSIETVMGRESRQIPVFKIDTLTASYAFGSNTLLKVDVDGIEMKVLNGAEKFLANDEVVIIIEASLVDEKPRFSNLVTYLSSMNYGVYDIIEPLYKQDWQLWQVDLVFVKNNSKYWGSRNFYQ